MPRPVIAINYYFTERDLRNRIFEESSPNAISVYMRAFRDGMAKRGADVVTIDMADFSDPNVVAALYFEYNWRMLGRDPFLKRVPFAKRALILLEPAIVNPTLYYTGLLRRRFSTVFTWDLRLLKSHPDYVPIRVPVGADPLRYRANPFASIAFTEKKLLVAVSSNRWHYMPQATFGLRRKTYRYFHRRIPEGFDLFGRWWDRPCSRMEKWLGEYPFPGWRGEIPGSWDEKVRKMAGYRFAICYENSTGQPGYISEKIFDCFCARCVPVYFGSGGIERFIPPETFINLRDFKSLPALADFLVSMDAAEHGRRLAAIDGFMGSERINAFTAEHMYDTIYAKLTGPRQ